MLLTILAVVAISSFSIFGQVSKRGGRRASRGKIVPREQPCPRCRVLVSTTATFCPGCGVPLQVFDYVTAPLAMGTVADDGDAPMRAHVRADLCVGCGSCVVACPEPEAIGMRNRLAVVEPAHCVGHGECADACPTGAITVAAGAAVNRVVVPMLDADFQTNVPGLYIVGELGGRGLIKNAINEGKVAVEHIAKVAAEETSLEDDAKPALDVVIVGSGPAGISAGLEALNSGLTYAVLEQASLAESVRKYPRHKILFAEPLHIPLYGDLWIADTSKESLLEAWEKVVSETGLRVDTERRVEEIVRHGWLYRVRAKGKEYRARRVVLAMGRRGTPRQLGVEGEELEKVVYDIAEMEEFAGRHVLVVGGGDSAIETALGLANQQGTTVSISYRGDSFDRVRPRLHVKLDAALAEGSVTAFLGSTVRSIRSDVVVLDLDGEMRILPNDDVVVRIGGEPPSAFLEQLGVRMVHKEVPLLSDVASAS